MEAGGPGAGSRSRQGPQAGPALWPDSRAPSEAAGGDRWVKAHLTPAHPALLGHHLCPHAVLGRYWVKTERTLVVMTKASHQGKCNPDEERKQPGPHPEARVPLGVQPSTLAGHDETELVHGLSRPGTEGRGGIIVLLETRTQTLNKLWFAGKTGWWT